MRNKKHSPVRPHRPNTRDRPSRASLSCLGRTESPRKLLWHPTTSACFGCVLVVVKFFCGGGVYFRNIDFRFRFVLFTFRVLSSTHWTGFLFRKTRISPVNHSIDAFETKHMSTVFEWKKSFCLITHWTFQQFLFGTIVYLSPTKITNAHITAGTAETVESIQNIPRCLLTTFIKTSCFQRLTTRIFAIRPFSFSFGVFRFWGEFRDRGVIIIGRTVRTVTKVSSVSANTLFTHSLFPPPIFYGFLQINAFQTFQILFVPYGTIDGIDIVAITRTKTLFKTRTVAIALTTPEGINRFSFRAQFSDDWWVTTFTKIFWWTLGARIEFFTVCNTFKRVYCLIHACFWTSRENVFESNLCSLYTSLPLDDTDVNVDDRKT